MKKNDKIDIRINNLCVSYGHVEALVNINLDIRQYDFVGIIGPNGGGKSTLIKTLLGIVPPTSGSIDISNKNGIGYVPQFPEFDKKFPITVKEVILMGLIKGKSYFFKKYSKDELKFVDEVIERLEITDLKNKQIGELSGGQLQKVLVARALVASPGILLLDEPTASLDVKVKNEIYAMLKELSKDVTIVIITHDIAEIFSFVTSVAYINKTLHYHGRDASMKKNVLELTTGCPIEDFILKEEALKKDFMDQEDKHDDSCVN